MKGGVYSSRCGMFIIIIIIIIILVVVIIIIMLKTYCAN